MEKIECNICGSGNSRLLYNITRDGMEITIVKCSVCGLVYQNPRLSAAEIKATYDRKKEHYRSKPDGGKENFFMALANGRITNIEKYAQKGKFLDIGSAFGVIATAAKNRGWAVEGIEIAGHMADFAEKKYGIRTHRKPLEEVSFRDKTFDAITMYDLIEHLIDPKSTVAECNRIMRKNGILVIQTPAIDSWYARLKGPDWPYFGVQHLYYFSMETMRRLLNDTGFEIVKVFNGDDIGMPNHIKASRKLRYLAFHAVRRLSIGKTIGSRVYYARKISEVKQ